MTRTSWPSPREPWQRRQVAEELCAEHPDRLAAVVVATVKILTQGSVGSLRKLRAAVRQSVGRCSDGDVDASVVLLGNAVRRTPGGRGSTVYTLDVRALPPELRRYFGL